MNQLTKDLIAIDANVFERLFNPSKNRAGHITILLTRLKDDQIHLLVDDKDKIVNEYYNRLKPHMKGEDEKRILLTHYWLLPGNRKVVCVNTNDKLMVAIKGIIPVKRGKPITDRFYVYVAFKKGRILVTNDRKDIFDNREELKRKTKKFCPRDGDIMTSQQAHDRL